MLTTSMKLYGQLAVIYMPAIPVMNSNNMQVSFRTHGLLSDGGLASGGSGQCFGVSSVSSGYPDNRYPDQDFLFHVLVIIYYNYVIVNFTFKFPTTLIISVVNFSQCVPPFCLPACNQSMPRRDWSLLLWLQMETLLLIPKLCRFCIHTQISVYGDEHTC